MPKKIILILSLFLICSQAFANTTPARETSLAMILMMPLTIFLFTISGAAKFHDQKEEIRWGCLGRFLAIVGATLLTILFGMQELMAMLGSSLIGLWAISYVKKMIQVSKEAPPGSYTRIASKCFGVILPIILLFFISFSFIFFGNRYQEMKGADWIYKEALQRFRQEQQDYAKSHSGEYSPIRDYPWLKRRDPKFTEITYSYGDDLRSYEVRIKPIAFYFFPYNRIAPRKSYYMDDSGVICYKEMTSPGEGANKESRILTEKK